MSSAYIDTSVLVCIAFREPGWDEAKALLDQVELPLASNLLEAELRSALAREGVEADVDRYLASIRWVFPDRRLAGELDRVLGAGYLRGADLWHLACALFVSPEPSMLQFLTLDERQRAVAQKLGFRV